MRRLFPLLLVLLVGCGVPSTPRLAQISPATMTAPTFYENSGTQRFTLTGARFAPDSVVLFGESVIHPATITATSLSIDVPPSDVNPEFPLNPSSQSVIYIRVLNPDGQTSNSVTVTVVPHCNPCGT